ncbi:MAG: cupin domain-containing protein [Actinomycetota bacterium]|nr:cupin domain-containing protein [Actinomycetota bacterium]
MTALPAESVKDLPAERDYLAPDGSEIRLLLSYARGGLAHCTLPPGKTSSAVRHRTVDELWYFLDGRGEIWVESLDEPVEVGPGRCVAIKAGDAFQFRATGAEPLVFLIATMPEWPGPHEAEAVQGRWAV